MGWIVLIVIIAVLFITRAAWIRSQIKQEIALLYRLQPGQIVLGRKIYKHYKSYAESVGARETTFEAGTTGYFFEQRLTENWDKVTITIMHAHNSRAYISVANTEAMKEEVLKKTGLDKVFGEKAAEVQTYSPVTISALLVGIKKGLLESPELITWIIKRFGHDATQVKPIIKGILLSSLHEGNYKKEIIEKDHRLSAIINKTSNEIYTIFMEEHGSDDDPEFDEYEDHDFDYDYEDLDEEDEEPDFDHGLEEDDDTFDDSIDELTDYEIAKLSNEEFNEYFVTGKVPKSFVRDDSAEDDDRDIYDEYSTLDDYTDVDSKIAKLKALDNNKRLEKYKDITTVVVNLMKLREDRDVREALILSASDIPVSLKMDANVKKIHDLMHRLSELTGLTLEELFNEDGLQRIIDECLDSELSQPPDGPNLVDFDDSKPTENEIARMTDDEFEEYFDTGKVPRSLVRDYDLESTEDFYFDNIFDDEIELVDIIEKTNNLPEGIFANINNDLNEHIKEKHPRIVKMAYAYARRTVAAGLYLQGVFSREHYTHASKIFKAMQLQTGHTVAFQEEAARQAWDLLASYDSSLDKSAVVFITSLVEHQQTPELYDGKEHLKYEVVLYMVQKALGKLPVERKESKAQKMKNSKNAPGLNVLPTEPENLVSSSGYKDEMEQILKERNIKYLTHFTQACNLDDIFARGLLTKDTLLDIDFSDNDQERYDHTDAICTSIEFPNYKMFYRLRKLNPDTEWAVLMIDARVLLDLECAFCTTNAASTISSTISLSERKGVNAFLKLFKDLSNKSRKSQGIEDNYPTDPQAEVLIFEQIPTQYIKEVHFESRSTASKIQIPKHINLKIDKAMFQPRLDYEHWK